MIPRLLLLGGALQPPSQPAPGVWHSTPIHSLNASQGLESDIVILSTVRTHRDRPNPFLDDKKRINVGSSRARERLVILSAVDGFAMHSKIWKKVFLEVMKIASKESSLPAAEKTAGFYRVPRHGKSTSALDIHPTPKYLINE